MKNLSLLSVFIIFFTFACEVEEPQNTDPETPNLTAPADLLTDVSSEGTTLRWNCTDLDGDALTYSIYFGEMTPPEIVKSETSSSTYSTGLLDAETSYYWQIEANDGNEGISTSAIFTFTTGKENDPDAVPENPYPGDEATNVSIPITFTWECINNSVTGYEVYMSADMDNIYESMVDAPADPTFTSSTLEGNTTYYWFVVGRTKNEQVSFVSNTWSFTTN